MEIESRVGQLFFVGFEGTGRSSSLDLFLDRLRPGGLIHFSRNIRDARQVRDLNDALARAVDPPPLVAVDQEGGRVSRLKPILPALPPAALFAGESDERLRAYGRVLGDALSALGFNTDFAPVVDLSSPGAPSGIGDRSFGEDPAMVARCAGAFVSGLGEAGIVSFLKHFPGLGATTVDSHLTLPVCSRGADEIWEHDLLPYRRCAAGAGGIMVGHAHYPALDPGASLPASLSRRIVTGLLRERMAFEGLVITDDLEMGAVAGPGPGELALQALLAGNDMVMFCNAPQAALEAKGTVLASIASGRLDEAQIDRSIERILTVKRRFGVTGIGGREPVLGLEAAIDALKPFGIA